MATRRAGGLVAVFVLDADDNIVAMNEAAGVLARRTGIEALLSRRGDAIEPLTFDAGELLRMATAMWRPTQRQREVLQYVLEGHTNKEIAEAMGVSPRTVEVHVTALLGKAGVESRARLIARARELAAHSYRSLT